MVRRIAIVEDQNEEAERLASYFDRYSKENDCSFLITRFEDGDSFLARYQPYFDVVFMDIMMPGTNGLETARELRKIDSSVTLVFVTNMARFAIRGYEVEAFDFVVKPVSYQNFVIKLNRVLAKLKNEQRNTYILLNLADGKKRISPAQIKYLEVNGHKVIYHTTEGTYPVYGSMKSAEEQLNPSVFSRCNNCYLINLNYVSAINGLTVTVDGEALQISRSRKNAFIQQLNEFLGGNF